MDRIIALIRSEPARTGALVQAVVTLAVAFGLHLSTVQQVAIDGLVFAVISEIVRATVTPTTKDPGDA